MIRLNTMRLLDKKNGRFHWKQEVSPGIWEFISDKENTRYWKTEQDKLDKIAAEIYNKAFNSEGK